MLQRPNSTKGYKPFLKKEFNSSKISKILQILTIKFRSISKMILLYDPTKNKESFGWVSLPNTISVVLYAMIWDSEKLYKLWLWFRINISKPKSTVNKRTTYIVWLYVQILWCNIGHSSTKNTSKILFVRYLLLIRKI